MDIIYKKFVYFLQIAICDDDIIKYHLVLINTIVWENTNWNH